MKLRTFPAAVASFALLSNLLAPAQQPTQFTDPANLRGERVKPRDGRELPIDQGERGLEQMLRKLKTRASLMLIVAHPDDEDGGMLTYYSRGLGARVAVLTLTRGEGGQNAVTGDFEDALGLLRTQELLSADRYLGVDQFFGTEVDFGFSKTKEEAFKKWTHERVLYDAVRSIRLYRPLVIAAVFIGGVTDGHGQHQVSGQIAQEAFKAAADPTVFPDMIAEGILPWQALKVYARVPSYSVSEKGLFDYATGKYTAPRFENYVTGEITTTVPSSDVIVHEGTADKLLSDNLSDPPRTYVQFARIGLGMQKSQIGGGVRVPPAGAFDVAYHLYGSALCSSPTHIRECHPERGAQRALEGSEVPPEPSVHNAEFASFFDGIDTSMAGIASLAPHAPPGLESLLDGASSGVDQIISGLKDPERAPDTALLLADATHRIDAAVQSIEKTSANSSFSLEEKVNVLHELRIKRIQFNNALVCALGLSLTPQASGADQTEGSPATTRLSLAVSSPMPLGADPWLSATKPLELTFRSGRSIGSRGNGSPIEPPKTAPSPDHPSDLVCILAADQSPATKPYFFRKSIERPTYDLLDDKLRNAPATPPALTCHVELALDWLFAKEQIVVIQLDAEASTLSVPPASISLSTHAQVLPTGQKSLTLPYKVSPSNLPVRARSTGEWQVVAGENDLPYLRVEALSSKPNPITVEANAILPGAQKVTEGYRSIGYGDLPRTNYYTPAAVRIVPVDLNLPTAHRIAIVPGTGDAVPEALASINLQPDILTIADLIPAKLAQYDTVVLGVRTYAAHPDLHGAPTQALLDYARSGGNVLVQYQTSEFTAADAPYPLSLGSNEKVVDETDPVQLLDTSAQFLKTPNKITPTDFNNWVEERGHGFLESWDGHYTALTETHDPDQDPQRGGLITTPLGKGRWTYCAFALYRQLPEAVPGAYRLFVNLLSPATSR